jgi:ferredoxin
MAYTINTKRCVRCGLCVAECPAKAIVVDEEVTESDGLVLYTTRIDPVKCTKCGVCVSYEYWCPAKAIVELKSLSPVAVPPTPFTGNKVKTSIVKEQKKQ